MAHLKLVSFITFTSASISDIFSKIPMVAINQ